MLLHYNVVDQTITESIAMTACGFRLGHGFILRSCRVSLLATVVAVCTPLQTEPVAAAERHHHAHEHGVSKLQIAMDGPVVEIQLVSPGMDIVGFEHAPTSDADKQALAKAAAVLADGASLFILSADARCGLADAVVEHPFLAQKAGRHEHGERHGHNHGNTHGQKHEHAGAPGDGHSAFQVHYRFQCENIGELTRLEVKLFEKFPAAKEIEVEAITPRGQIARELTPASPLLRL
jgi:hypothetical protein